MSSYFVGSVQNHQETITYTVYNEQADAETGVLLTDTLQPGVTFQNASQPPDQSGQKLAWSLGTIGGFDRASVTLTVNLPGTIPAQLDRGAQAFAFLDGAAVSNSTPAATLRAGNVSDPSLLASTPDANTTDPFVQEEAAKLNYDPQQIFNFLHNDISYNSYLGSVRGARGTLWSSAGNALDVASLGVALMRASGIPAQYEQGTLSQGQAQPLLLSMFPKSFQTVGFIPAGTQTADPANDPKLLAETEKHFWFQFDVGSGMNDADPLMTGTVGLAITTSTGGFNAVPDNLREKTEIQVTAETYSLFNALLGGTGLSTQTVLDQTFNDVDLVGRPLSIGNLVSTQAQGLGITQIVHTYSPYIVLGDEAFPNPSKDQTISGTSYQEVYSNADGGLVSQELTGLFLNATLSGPQGPAETFQHTILDRIGIAARQNSNSLNFNIPASNPPAFSDFDITAVNVLAGLQNPKVNNPEAEQLTEVQTQINQLRPNGSVADTAQTAPLLSNFSIEFTRFMAEEVMAQSDALTAELAYSYEVAAYFGRPRVIVTSQQTVENTGTQKTSLDTKIDLLGDGIQAVAYPGQAANAPYNFNIARGFGENAVETSVAGSANSSSAPVSTQQVLAAAVQQGIPLALLAGSSGIPELDSFGIDPDATARMTAALQAGQLVLVPTGPVTIAGKHTTAWFQTDPNSGYTTGVTADGGHESLLELVITGTIDQIVEKGLEIVFSLILDHLKFETFGFVTGFYSGEVFSVSLIADQSFLPLEEVKKIKEEELAFVKQMAGAALKAELFLIAVELTTGVAVPSGFFTATHSVGEGFEIAVDHFSELAGIDPTVDPQLSDLANPLPVVTNVAINTVAETANTPSGNLNVLFNVPNVAASGQLTAIWSNANASAFQVTALNAHGATVTGANGNTVGSGAVGLSAATLVGANVAGNNQYSVNGSGSLSFYGPAETSIGVSGNWTNYSATVAGNVSITLTTDGLTLNGRTLPVGTYTITTTSATLGGSGKTTSPNFSGAAALNVTGGTVTLGTGNGSITVGGNPLDLRSGATLDGYTGRLIVAAGGGNSTDAVTLNGNVAKVLTVSGTPNTLSTDQNTPKTFQVNVNTSLADTYNLLTQAPPGWTVSVDTNGQVTVKPAPGLQGGTFPIQVIAQSQKNPNLVAQTTVNVTITPTTAGTTLTVVTDPLLTVPVNGAELPTAFQVQIHNNGPTPVTENLAFSNVPSGFILLKSGSSVTIPAGQTGIIGVYLVPTSGQLPAVGTSASFTVTATNAANPGDVHQFNEQFTVPAVNGITLTSNPVQVNTLPGVTGMATLTVTNVGNVSETVTLASSNSTGLMVAGLQTVSVPAGQSATEILSLTPSASTSLNTLLQTTITATFGPANAPLRQTLDIPVDVVIVGARAAASAAVSAGQVGAGNLAGQLNDLSTDLTNFEPNTANAVFKSQVLADLTAVAALLPADPFLAPFAAGVTTDRGEIANAVTAGDFQTAFTDLANTMTSINRVLSEEVANGFTLSLSPNSAVALPTTPSQVTLLLQNNGNATTTYDLSVSGLPANVTAVFPPKVTLLSAQILGGVSLRGIPITLTETGGALFPTAFTVTATPEGAPDIARSVPGTLTVRPTFVDVTQVVVTPTLAPQGTPVNVTARLLNSINQQQQALASYTVADPAGHVVFTSPLVAITLNVVSLLSSVDLGSFPTTSLANGVYTATVTINDTSGHLIPGGTNQGTVLIGTAVSATLTTAPTTLPPGNGTVTTTFQVSALAGAAQSASVTVPTNNGVAIVPGSFNIAPTTITPGSGSETLTWNFSALPAGVLFFTGNLPARGIEKLDLATGAITNVLQTGIGLGGPLTFDNNGDIIYTPGFGFIDLFNPATNTITPIASGLNFPSYFTLEPGGNSVLVVSGESAPDIGTISRINLTTGAVSTLISGLDRPSGVAYDDKGNLFVESGTGSLAFQQVLFQVDPTTGAILQTIKIPGAIIGGGVTFDPSTGALWVAQNGTPALFEVSNYLTSPQVQRFPPPPTFPFLDFISIVSDGQGNIYLGTDTSGIGVYNIATNTYTAVTAPSIGTLGGIAPLVGLGAPPNSQTFTWQSTVSNLQPAEARNVTLGATVNFTSQGSPTTLTLPRTVVTGAQILALNPASQTVAPESAAAYTVTVTNPTNSADTFNLAVLGVPASWVSLQSSVPVAANSSVNVTLTLTSDALATLGDHGFTVTAKDRAGASAFVQGDLILAGLAPAPPNIEAHGVVVTLTPTEATAGQGTPARYLVQVTNTGSAADTFSLTTVGLSANITATFSRPTIVVAPGEKSFRDILLTLTPLAGTPSSTIPFQVTAISTTLASVNASARATLVVVKQGVQLSLSPAAGAPGSTFSLKVTNTGTARDTFDLSLAGPAALVSKLALTKVTLAAGASTTVSITTSAVNFATPGALPLIGIAKSEGNSRVQATATAALQIPGTKSMTAQLSPTVQVIPLPGGFDFLVFVHNTGNLADDYTAILTGSSGPIQAQLIGLDGLRAKKISTFQLPGLATAALVLHTNLATTGTGIVNILIHSLTDPTISTTTSATVIAKPSKLGRRLGPG